MSRQISIRWDRDIEENFEDSLRSMMEYRSPPDITVTSRLKGPQDIDVVRALEGLARSKDLEIQVTLTATWDEEADVRQLRLWGPPTAQEAVVSAAKEFSSNMQDMVDRGDVSGVTLRSGDQSASWGDEAKDRNGRS